MMFDAEYKVSMLGNTLSRTPLTPCTDCSGSPMDHRSFDDWGAYWRAIDGAWDGIETVNELGLWTAPLQIQRSSYEIEQLEDAGENVRPLTVAGRPVVVDISDGDLSVKWGEHTLVSARIAQWRPCDEREKDCFRESPDHVAAWMWSEHIYVVGNLSQTTESALVRFSPPPDLPSPLIACRHGRSVGLSLRVRALLAAHGVSPPAGTSSAEGKTSARDHGLSKRLEAIEAAMDAKNAKALKPLLTALGKAAARPHDVLVPAWLTWVELARDRQEHAQKEAKRVLADVPRHAATCKAQIAVYERAEEAERRASASGQVSVAMAKNKAKRNAAKLICEASQGLQDAVEKYKRLGMSDSADAVRRAHRFCFDICD